MLKIHPVALAALCGLGSPSSSLLASAAGCHPAYVPGAPYAAKQTVSVTKSTKTTTTVSCAIGTTGCNGGFKTETKTTTTKRNYECKSGMASAWCSQSGFAPGGVHGGSAWNDMGSCTGTAKIPSPTPPPTPALWNGGGCPAAFAAGTSYDAADVVSVRTSAGYTMVYQCAAEPQNQYCGSSGFEPGTSQYWEQAWTSLGSCKGTIAPTSSPAFVSLVNEGGCPSEYAASEGYEAGDKIAKDGLVYKCKAAPLDRHCSQAGYEPGTSIGFGAYIVEHWKEAWDVVGYCSGTIAPTTSPDFVSLPNLGGCPADWAAKPYEEGDLVHSLGLVFKCNAWPLSGHCGQAGYEPNTDPATPDAWKAAWTLAGYCSGSMVPTGSPNFDPANSVGVCPEEWSPGSNVKYEEGDMVSVTVSRIPVRKVAYRCRAWPYSGHCGQYSPTQYGGNQGWTFAGSCDGSIGPTASPAFDDLAVDASGCPEEWSAYRRGYEAGDRVSYSVSKAPMRKIVFKCRDWPNTGYCSQGAAYEPTTQYANMAWALVGACSGSIAPTSSPVQYANPGTCRYERCRLKDVTCAPGSAGCSCGATTPAGPNCLKEERVCVTTNVDTWKKSASYAAGDVVRIGAARFRCKTWPEELWCSNESYRPEIEKGIWRHAWIKMDDCP